MDLLRLPSLMEKNQHLTQFNSAIRKAKNELDENPKYKLITLGDFNATLSSQSKASGA